MTYIITGKTFKHRFRLKDLGATWNGERKGWIITPATPEREAELFTFIKENDLTINPEGAKEMQKDLFGTPEDPKAAPRPKTPARNQNPAEIAAQITALLSTMQSPALDDEAIRAIVKDEVKKHPAPRFEIKTPDGEVKEIKETTPEVFPKVLALAQARKNILLVGPAGCGKTHLAEIVAKALDLPFYFISISAGLSEAQLAGWLVPTGEAGRFEYRKASFVKAYEEGGVFLMDEIDNGDANTLNFINAALANGKMPVPNRTEKPYAERHTDFICIAAANTYGNGASRQYVGRNQLDAATLDRFRIGTVTMDYDPSVEAALVDAAVLKWGQKVREAITAAGLRRIVSTRFLRDLSDMKTQSPEHFGNKAAWTATLAADWSPDERNRIANL